MLFKKFLPVGNFSLSVLFDCHFWTPEISRQPIKFGDGSVSTFDGHMYSFAKLHAFNQKSNNPCTYPPLCISKQVSEDFIL